MAPDSVDHAPTGPAGSSGPGFVAAIQKAESQSETEKPWAGESSQSVAGLVAVGDWTGGCTARLISDRERTGIKYPQALHFSPFLSLKS